MCPTVCAVQLQYNAAAYRQVLTLVLRCSQQLSGMGVHIPYLCAVKVITSWVLTSEPTQIKHPNEQSCHDEDDEDDKDNRKHLLL
jgi:hypothetical protein